MNLKQFRKYVMTCILFVMVFFVNQTYAIQKKVVTGTVTDARGESLIGVSIIIKGTTVGTISDIDGKFSLEANAGDILVFNFMGYLDEEVQVGDQTEINVVLETDLVGLDEVIVTGYGRQKKSDLTGAIASVSSEKLTEMPALGVDDALQGRASGVSIVGNSGRPGSNSTIQIRGISSINGSDPLVIVDGVRASLDGLNPSDIESVEILKDASSAAIYGSSGGNGVILVTTKKGKSGKPMVSFDYFVGQQKPWRTLDVMDAQEYAEAMNLILALRGKGKDAFTSQPDTLKNYDWQKNMMTAALQQNYNLSVSGGNDHSTYFMSVNYQDQEGIVETSDYSKLGFRINSEHKINKYIKIGENASFTQSRTDGYAEWQFQNAYNNPIQDILIMHPYLEPYDANGNWSVAPDGNKNPVMSRDILNTSNLTQSTGGNVYVDITPYKGLVITSKVNAWTNYTTSDAFNMEYEYNPTTKNENNSVTKEMNNRRGWEAQNYINYNTTIAEAHNIGAMAGIEAAASNYNHMRGERFNLINESEEMRYFDASTNDTLLSQLVEGGRDAYNDASYAYFGRLTYDYLSKYLLTVNVRKDYSSRFGPANRSGVFPSFSLGWKFSEESFLNDINALSFGKMRFGYGETGANAPDRYAYYSSVLSTNASLNYIFDGSNNTSSGATLAQMPNAAMHWETMIMSNFGVDLTFFKDQLSFSADWFRKESDGMLMYQNLPASVGMYQGGSTDQWGGDARPITNIGKFRNQGFEFNVGYKDVKHAVKSSFDFNFTYVKNEVVDIAGDSIYNGEVGPNLRDVLLTAEGAPISQFYGYETNGLFTWDDATYNEQGKVYIKNQPFVISNAGDTVFAQKKAKPGDLRFVDQNGDGRIDAKDKVNLGSPVPKFIFGFSANFEYKGFDLNMFLEGKFGYKILNGTKTWGMNNQEGPNRLAAVLDQYYDPIYDNDGELLYEGNTNTDLPRLDPKGENGNYTTMSDIFLEKGNYVRLKNLQLGYSFKPSLLSKVGVEKLRVYVGVKNLLTITKYSGNDPEIAPINGDPILSGIETGGTYAQNRMFLTGLSVKF